MPATMTRRAKRPADRPTMGAKLFRKFMAARKRCEAARDAEEYEAAETAFHDSMDPLTEILEGGLPASGNGVPAGDPDAPHEDEVRAMIIGEYLFVDHPCSGFLWFKLADIPRV